MREQGVAIDPLHLTLMDTSGHCWLDAAPNNQSVAISVERSQTRQYPYNQAAR